ncbi:CHAD domain-containing protein [Nocardia higoensis]|uniref:CHAD domain-containing protein n=1 Tax=Nocardia higoensis TaxID=228599 RepID=A0ABS0DF71_9NOCA|nr:CHAD domain-containing protein [Nocardia higoensis]MBF6357126.1 CHAD domain-containing protein [Nocardia higoensis]
MTKKAGKAVTTALAEDIERMLGAEPDVRADAYDSVHQMRVATRRLRSVLRSYRTLFRRSETEELSAELKWLAGLLGVARDAEVRAERFAALPDTGDEGEAPTAESEKTDDAVDSDGEPDDGAGTADSHDRRKTVVDRLVEAQRARYADAHAEVLTALDSERYAELRETLEHWRTDPPLRGKRGRAPAAKVFRAVLDRDTERLRTRISTEPDLPEDDRVEALHDIRKAAKRLRYSAEAAALVLGEDAADLSARAKKVQSVLGDHRDAVEAAQVILAAASRAEAVHTATVADIDLYVRLAAAEEAAAARELERYPEVAQAFTAGSHHERSAD